MKRLIAALVCVLLMMCALTVFATAPRLVDEAGLLTQDEAAQLQQQLDEISLRQGVDVVIVTVDSTQGASPMDFADDYFDYHDYGSDGILLLVSMEDRDWWISTTGYGITAITDAGLDYISQEFLYYLSDGEYALAFETFATLCDDFLTQAYAGQPYDSGNLPEEPFDPLWTLIVSLAIAFVIALIVTAIMKGQLKSVRFQAKADNYVQPGSMQLTNSRDLFLYTHVSKTERPQNTGGSSTHTSSSGRSHGGGGGKF